MHFESSSYTYRCIILFLYPCAVRIVFQIKALNMWVVEHMWEPCVDRHFVVYNIYVGMWKKADKLLWRSLVGKRESAKLLNKANKNTNIIFFLIIQSFNKLLYESRVQLFIFFLLFCWLGCSRFLFPFFFSFFSQNITSWLDFNTIPILLLQIFIFSFVYTIQIVSVWSIFMVNCVCVGWIWFFFVFHSVFDL